ncbi:MAG: hypothetical protein QOJ28_2560 [Mycobacterium sp.]|jgi:hypothetical protein|nr:hypothetical protein [Mycobacterium sp.]
MRTRNVLIALVGATVVIGTAACGNSSSSKPGPTSETFTTAPTTSAPTTPTPSSTPTIMTTASSACSDLGGMVVANQVCSVHTATPDYTIDMKFPVDYPDQGALSDLLTRERDQFVEVVSKPDQPPYAKELDITPTTYRSAAGDGTESLVLQEHADYGGAHGETFYNALNYDLGKKAPITYDTLFKPGTDPVAVLDPIVKAEFEKLLDGTPIDDNINGAKTYQNFALTDDAVIFFIGQGDWAFEAAGPQQFSIPRSELASILA